jgi:hypothetical protein
VMAGLVPAITFLRRREDMIRQSEIPRFAKRSSPPKDDQNCSAPGWRIVSVRAASTP